ncbi:GAF domain-containing protein [Streptomyces sp. 4N124]|uniref:GAF domain-containing protein n=1 Tax=Streptomyces sp. 4N124 TaxID=3457420 RepID=UPI003FD171A7
MRLYDILDTPPDGAFDRIAALAARLFDAPAATVTIVDTDRVWFKATYGLAGVRQIGRDPGLCTSAILTGGPLVVPDTLDDPVARAHCLVTGPARVRFYAAAPITTGDGHRLGTVDVLDTRPRRITPDQATALIDLAALVMDELELRLSALRMLRVERELVHVGPRPASLGAGRSRKGRAGVWDARDGTPSRGVRRPGPGEGTGELSSRLPVPARCCAGERVTDPPHWLLRQGCEPHQPQ